MRFSKSLLLPLLLLGLTGCGSIADDLVPSGADQRPSVEAGTTGPAVGQFAPDFTLPDVDGNSVTLASALVGRKGIVLYFTMWCPVCDSHMSSMVRNVIPNNPDVTFFAVDYVSGSIAGARDAQSANGYVGSGLIVLADIDQSLLAKYRGTMGTTVLIDSSGVVRMNEDYQNGARLIAALGNLP